MMKEHEFQDAICTIEETVQTLPPDIQPRLMQAIQETIQRHGMIVETCKKARKSAVELENAQADMSLTTKYMLFDLECVARELKGKESHGK